MASCINMWALRFRILGSMQQCAKNSATNRKQCFRELRTYVGSNSSTLPTFRNLPRIYPPRVNLRMNNIKFVNENAIFHTSCNYLSSDDKPKESEEKKMSAFQKLKRMGKDYWYVLIPVHVATSIVWFGVFYYLSISFDIPLLLDHIGAPESLIEKVKGSQIGNVVVAYTLYKAATPVRYTVTIGGTTLSIKYLRKWGWIKPAPNKEDIKKMYQEKKGAFKDFMSTYEKKIQTKTEDLKSEVQQHYIDAREGLHRSVAESRNELKKGMKDIKSECKHIGQLVSKEIKKSLTGKNEPDIVAKLVDDKEKKKK